MEVEDTTTSDEYSSLVDAENVRALILDYLVHHCYLDTAESFMSACGLEKIGEESESQLQNRKRIMLSIRKGEILDAIKLTNELFPGVLEQNQEVRFKLLCQHFIELIRERKNQEALAFAQQELNCNCAENQKKALQNIFPLIAYENPETSPIGGCLSEVHREGVVNSLNSAILESKNLPKEPSLELLLRHLTVAMQVLPPRDKPKKVMKGKWSLENFINPKASVKEL
eukprot:CAMPEP_0174256932 /NCGR_PEP_ID=MMETSP0439-20130205/6131_1 /TAXON_ID=0 /ORGANISM="Stereomyxa ramosa, Strain Chinc5" /LENGTH=227 /DNA_ID=CAMNT_0015339785 /DNA_START=17 /DNA_END=700 /DNA_ORIENTATION=-